MTFSSGPISRNPVAGSAPAPVLIIPADRNFLWNPGMTSKGGVVSGTYHYTTVFTTINTQTPGWTGNASITTHFVDGSVAPTGTLTINSTSTGTMATGLTILDGSNNPLGVVASGAGSTWTLSSNFLSQGSQAMSG